MGEIRNAYTFCPENLKGKFHLGEIEIGEGKY
jgi:hypothetical protein